MPVSASGSGFSVAAAERLRVMCGRAAVVRSLEVLQDDVVGRTCRYVSSRPSRTLLQHISYYGPNCTYVIRLVADLFYNKLYDKYTINLFYTALS